MAISKANLRLVSNNPDPADTGDRACVEALYSAHRSALCRYIARMLPGGRQDVEVILHETYIRLLRQDSLQHLRQNPRAYIYTVATNLVRDSLRRQSRRCSEQHHSYDDSEHESREITPQGAAEWQQSLGRLKQSLRGLKPVVRRVFLLSRFEQMTYPEIAEALSISTRSVERHMRKAIEHLQRELSDIL
ncbi:RNA polymerase sigma factor [Microbulbifer halophilus]|uniref:RNA polymerase sigma factor n=1 Tax=Microbulbifer halophilus TaxID=453963 RepID=A0ABW5EGC0_9GAMM|nr:RNA polymerase sigma factor [Microbulbifer halophilus]MCW8126957.1 RNA polymerase sigma factor [Microbulbifer halophilus]